MISRYLLLAIAIAVFTSCGGKEKGNADANEGEPNSPNESLPPAEPEETPAERQQKLADEAIALITRVADVVVSITDLDTAKAAAASIAAIDTEFQALAKKMEQAGQPAPELVTKFREAYKLASDAMAAHIGKVMPKLTDQPDVMKLLNETFTSFGKTLSHPSFKNYGIDGE